HCLPLFRLLAIRQLCVIMSGTDPSLDAGSFPLANPATHGGVMTRRVAAESRSMRAADRPRHPRPLRAPANANLARITAAAAALALLAATLHPALAQDQPVAPAATAVVSAQPADHAAPGPSMIRTDAEHSLAPDRLLAALSAARLAGDDAP